MVKASAATKSLQDIVRILTSSAQSSFLSLHKYTISRRQDADITDAISAWIFRIFLCHISTKQTVLLEFTHTVMIAFSWLLPQLTFCSSEIVLNHRLLFFDYSPTVFVSLVMSMSVVRHQFFTQPKSLQ